MVLNVVTRSVGHIKIGNAIRATTLANKLSLDDTPYCFFFSEYIDTIIRTQSKNTGTSERYRCCALHEGLCGDAALPYRTCQVDAIDVVCRKFCTDSPGRNEERFRILLTKRRGIQR